MNENIKILGENKKARFNYFVEDSLEAGLVLQGTEVKSIRAHSFSFGDAFVQITLSKEAFLEKFHIASYYFGSYNNHDNLRRRKLLLHKREIEKWFFKTQAKGYTIVPLTLYLKKGHVKVKIGLCRGKKLYDKRETLKKKTQEREVERQFRTRFQ